VTKVCCTLLSRTHSGVNMEDVLQIIAKNAIICWEDIMLVSLTSRDGWGVVLRDNRSCQVVTNRR
jgi:hypothetical protein